jgi:hypothetical protein
MRTNIFWDLMLCTLLKVKELVTSIFIVEEQANPEDRGNTFL